MISQFSWFRLDDC